MKLKFFIPLIVISVFSGGMKAIAHGVTLEAKNTQAIEIDATYDNGEPMSQAQVTVYAPDNPSTPWLKGTSDENGNFVFKPDHSQPGNWTIQVRKAGHGNIINVPVDDEKTAAEESNRVSQIQQTPSESRSFTPLQMVLMGAATIWGFVGTALFFSRDKQKPELQQHES